MNKIHLIFLVGQGILCFLFGCHKETSDLDTLPIIPVFYQEIIDSNLIWRYDPTKKILSADLKGFKTETSPSISLWIKGVYQLSGNSYYEVPWGNSGNSDKIYYEIEMKFLILHKKINLDRQMDLDGNGVVSFIEAAIANAYGNPYAQAIASMKLPKMAKVVFR